MAMLDFTATIESMKRQADKVCLMRVSLDKPIDFKAGQFMSFIFEIQGQKIVKPFSIASSPKEKNILEFSIKMGEPQTASYYLLHKKKGEMVKLKGPSGAFRVKESSKDKVFMGSGTGVAPLRSMIYELLEARTSSKLTLMLGARTPKDLLFYSELLSLSKTHPNFTFIPVVSNPPQDWKGKKGYVQDHLDVIQGMNNHDFYLCGPPAMVEDAKSRLLVRGVAETDIMQEKFG